MESEPREIMIYPDKMESSAPLSYEDIRQNTLLVRKCLKEVMKDKIDYGKIPGCGDKPSLLKPGAEKLMLLFKLGCFIEANDQSEPDIIKYVVKTRIVHIPTNRDLGIGLGSCSSDEEKYKWRKAVCNEEYEATVEGRRRLKWYRGKYNTQKRSYGPSTSVKQVRTNPADLNNTILKMAAKRSKVDGVITVTAASDILSQDIDEINEGPNREEPIQKPEAAAKREREPGEEGDPPAFSAVRAPTDAMELSAKFDSVCKGCDKAIKKGETILYSKGKGAWHPKCG